MQSTTVLIVEDDSELADLIRDALETEGFSVWVEMRGDTAVSSVKRHLPDLVVLDVMLPGLDGFAVCREIRQHYKGPIMFMTARVEDVDQILSFELGADDFVVKPIRPRVLIARIRALLRRVFRGSTMVTPSVIEVDGLSVSSTRREVYMRGRRIELTTVEFDVLWFLACRVGCVVSRNDLYQMLYNYDHDGLDRSVDVHISNIRQKIGDATRDAHYIKTVRGKGYLLAGGH